MTGREIERALLKAVDDEPNIFLFGHHFAIDLLTSQVRSYVTACLISMVVIQGLSITWYFNQEP